PPHSSLFFLTGPPPPHITTLSLHDALPICDQAANAEVQPILVTAASIKHPRPLPRDTHLGFEVGVGRERPRDQAVLLRFLEQPLRSRLVRARRYVELSADIEVYEAGNLVFAVEHTFDVALHGRPFEFRRPGNCLEGQYEAVCYRGDQQRLRRPFITGAAVLRG